MDDLVKRAWSASFNYTTKTFYNEILSCIVKKDEVSFACFWVFWVFF